MGLTRRLLIAARGGGAGFESPYVPPDLVATGPYDPGFSPVGTLLTQVHCHTNQSDGSYSPAAVVAYYLAKGYDALMLSDHDKITAQPAGIATVITGNELSPTTQHIIAMNSPSYLRGAVTDAQTIIDAVAASGGLTEIAHPKWYRGVTGDELQTLTGYTGIEIHNSQCIDGSGSNPVTYPGFAVDWWDQLLTAGYRSRWGYAVDDFHDNTTYHLMDSGRLRVFAEANTLSDVMASIEDGNFVADVSNYGVTPGYPTRDDTGVGVTCAGATRIEAYGTGGTLLAAASGTSLSYAYTGEESYVRLEAVGDYTEPFSGALDDRWRAVAGTWSVSGGTLTHTDSGSANDRIILRRHRAGDFTAQVDTYMTSVGNALMFNVLSNSYYYMLRLGRTGSPAGYANTLALAKTTNGSFGTPLASALFAPAASTWYTVKMAYTEATGTIRAKVWLRSDPEPADWMLTYSDTSWKHGAFGLRADGAPQFDNLSIDGFRTYYQPISVDPA